MRPNHREIHTQVHHFPQDCWLYETPVWIIYNGPPSRPHQVAFYDMQGEGRLLLPSSSMGTLLLDLYREARSTFREQWDVVTFSQLIMK